MCLGMNSNPNEMYFSRNVRFVWYSAFLALVNLLCKKKKIVDRSLVCFRK